MTRKEQIEKVLNEKGIKEMVKQDDFIYVAHLLEEECFSEFDDGRFGKIFEITAGLYLKGYRGNITVSTKGKIDITYKGKKFEAKSNCGSFLADIKKNDFMIYSYDNKADYIRPQNAHVIPMSEFLEGLEACGLFRKSKHTSAKGLTMAIQSYTNSKRKLTMWTGFIDKYPTLAEYKARA